MSDARSCVARQSGGNVLRIRIMAAKLTIIRQGLTFICRVKVTITHSHHHGEPGEHEHSDELPINYSESGSDFEANLPVDHDNGALYFGEHDNLQITPNRIGDDSPTFITQFVDTAIPRIANSERQTQVTRAGPFTPYCFAIYLQTRRLLL